MRPIDADALEPDADYDDGEFWAYSIEQVQHAPTIEPERKKGKWIVYYECPKCGEITKDFTEYCPFCNADMRGEEDE